jgi:sodium/potassium-transporting ATPase subunit alpha
MQTRSRFKTALNIDNSEAKVDFNSEHKFVMKIYEIEGDENCFFTAYMKGAPERVWDKCNKILIDG